MIFQSGWERVTRRNGRREGPIFEGDESLLGGKVDWQMMMFLLRDLIIRTILKGESSEAITLWAYNIPASYMVRANNLNELDNYLDPNNTVEIVY